MALFFSVPQGSGIGAFRYNPRGDSFATATGTGSEVMKKLLILCVVCLVSIVLAAPAVAQWDAQAFEDHMRQSSKKALEKRDSALSTLLTLTDDQKKAFRPLQKGYDKDLKALGKKRRDLMREFSQVHDKLGAATAEDLGRRFFDLERESLQLQQKYLESISAEVSPVAAVLFIQLQRRFETEVSLERMKYSPLAE